MASECVTLQEDGYFKTATFDPHATTDAHPMAHVWVNQMWGPEPGNEYLFYACDAADPASSHLLMQRGDWLDLDGDGTDEAMVDRVGIPGYPDIAFSDSQLYTGVDLIIDGEILYAILGLNRPQCGGLGGGR